MKVYIAGSISNDPDFSKKFASAERRLTKAGFNVINPAKNGGFNYKSYIDIGLIELMQCEAIYLLKGWKFSSGALLERHYAETVGLQIIEE